VLAQEEESERLDLAARHGAGSHRQVLEADPLPPLERVAEAIEHAGVPRRRRLAGGEDDRGRIGAHRVHREVAGQLAQRRLDVTRQDRITERDDPHRRVHDRRELGGVEGQQGQRPVPVAVHARRLGRLSVLKDREIREIEVFRGKAVARHLARLAGHGPDRNPELAELVLVALELPAQTVRVAGALVGRDVRRQLLEARREMPAKEGGEQIDPALDLGHAGARSGSVRGRRRPHDSRGV
jgi:hypothetical protein